MPQREVHIVHKTKNKKRRKKNVGMKGIYTKQVNSQNVNKFESSGKKETGRTQKSMLFMKSTKTFQIQTFYFQYLPVKLH